MNALPADDGVASPLKKRPGRQGGVGADLRMAFGGGAPFDAFRQGFGDAAALVVLVDVEAVEVLAVPVGESDVPLLRGPAIGRGPAFSGPRRRPAPVCNP